MVNEPVLAEHTGYPCALCRQNGHAGLPIPCVCGEGLVHCTRTWEQAVTFMPKPLRIVEYTCTACGGKVGGRLPWNAPRKPPEPAVAKPTVSVEPEVKKDEDGLYVGVTIKKEF